MTATNPALPDTPELPKLPRPYDSGPIPKFSADQMHAYLLADRSARAPTLASGEMVPTAFRYRRWNLDDAGERVGKTHWYLCATDPRPFTNEDSAPVAEFQHLYAATAPATSLLASEPAMSEWQSMDSAPKDAHILLRIDVAIGSELVVQGCWYGVSKRDRGWMDMEGRVVQVTHWQLLPSAPATPGETK